MRNPWRMQDGPDNKINRNNFPMSFQYNGTFKYGKIYPIGLIRTIPGASYQIDSTLALNFMPTVFPIQTRQRAYVHFFYGRDRNFWKDYKDFVNGMNPDLVKPYIDEGVTKARTGNLLDYLGVPTTLVGSYGTASKDTLYEGAPLRTMKSATYSFATGGSPIVIPSITEIKAGINNTLSLIPFTNTGHWNCKIMSSFSVTDVLNISHSGLGNRFAMTFDTEDGLATCYTKLPPSFLPNKGTQSNQTANYVSPSPIEDNIMPSNGLIFAFLSRTTPSEVETAESISISSHGKFYPTVEGSRLIFDFSELNLDNLTDYTIHIVKFDGVALYEVDSWQELVLYNGNLSTKVELLYSSSSIVDIDDTTSPYWRSNDLRGKKTIKLSAIPLRMYETIYNLYYRNPQNNPYMLNGKPEYNVFIPTKDGGADNNLYELRYRNWEDDFLTTAVQTPQQGIAPLVGLTDRGATVTLTNEDGTVTRYKTNLDENGNVTAIETTDSSEPLLTQALIDAVSYGISIEDLRNVNAMQKWLELNLRKGYQYKDIIEARWGISISYNELDLPEFIGGFTQEVGLQAVTQTATTSDTIEGALGWQAGRMYAAGSGRSITHYCEEEGYIMALLTVVPVPNYSQLLPKHWFTRDLLESYQPEFNHIGFQPITYKEVCPIQAFQESTENVDVLEQTFGYQRPWYEYFNQVDEVHGQFRNDFKDYLINRTFDVKPELSESFLLVDPNQVNDVFAVQTDDDKIIGAIEHRIIAKLPISLYAQARLE